MDMKIQEIKKKKIAMGSSIFDSSAKAKWSVTQGNTVICFPF